MYCRFPLTHGTIHGEPGAIDRLNLKYALALLPYQFHEGKYSEIHVFLVCHFVL